MGGSIFRHFSTFSALRGKYRRNSTVHIENSKNHKDYNDIDIMRSILTHQSVVL